MICSKAKLANCTVICHNCNRGTLSNTDILAYWSKVNKANG